MPQIRNTKPRTKAELVKLNGGYFAIAVCIIALMVALRAVANWDMATLGLAAMGWAAGAALLWYANRMALDALSARETGKALKATVLAVQHIAKDDGWATILPKSRLVWEDENFNKGQSTLHPHLYIRQWLPGDEITVYRGAQSTWWEGDVGQRITVPSGIPKVSAHPAE